MWRNRRKRVITEDDVRESLELEQLLADSNSRQNAALTERETPTDATPDDSVCHDDPFQQNFEKLVDEGSIFAAYEAVFVRNTRKRNAVLRVLDPSRTFRISKGDGFLEEELKKFDIRTSYLCSECRNTLENTNVRCVTKLEHEEPCRDSQSSQCFEYDEPSDSPTLCLWNVDERHEPTSVKKEVEKLNFQEEAEKVMVTMNIPNRITPKSTKRPIKSTAKETASGTAPIFASSPPKVHRTRTQTASLPYSKGNTGKTTRDTGTHS